MVITIQNLQIAITITCSYIEPSTRFCFLFQFIDVPVYTNLDLSAGSIFLFIPGNWMSLKELKGHPVKNLISQSHLYAN